MVIANGAWVALALNLVGGLARYLLLPPRPACAGSGRASRLNDNNAPGNIDAIFGALFVRIFVTQAAIIFGGMLVKSYGSIAALTILIVLKTLIDLSGGLNGMQRTVTVQRK